MIFLRRATQTDVPAIKALVHDAYAPWIPIIGREPGPMLFDYAEMVERHIFDLHHIGNDLAALIQMQPADDHLVIVNVAVAPAFQGRGLGSALMAHAEEVAIARGLGEVRLYTNKLMHTNRQLYERLGYSFDREEAFRGGIVVHMTMRLPRLETPSRRRQ